LEFAEKFETSVHSQEPNECHEDDDNVCVPLHFQIALVGREHTLLSNHEKHSHLLAFRGGGCEFLPSRHTSMEITKGARFGAGECNRMMMMN
jgi:hypothetical protein